MANYPPQAHYILSVSAPASSLLWPEGPAPLLVSCVLCGVHGSLSLCFHLGSFAVVPVSPQFLVSRVSRSLRWYPRSLRRSSEYPYPGHCAEWSASTRIPSDSFPPAQKTFLQGSGPSLDVLILSSDVLQSGPFSTSYLEKPRNRASQRLCRLRSRIFSRGRIAL
ncbi:hypothetical protein WMY93_011769 [Mugilogobius chulae]|uniref:Uncharacterized protein n=1 Tax=Mugilogobius chulae TaxID=88201 RepID=A0AAW0P9M1_9GOBI